jgi:hypothetical protein
LALVIAVAETETILTEDVCFPAVLSCGTQFSGVDDVQHSTCPVSNHITVFAIAFDTMLLPSIHKCNIFSLPTLELMLLNSVHASHSCVSRTMYDD